MKPFLLVLLCLFCPPGRMAWCAPADAPAPLAVIAPSGLTQDTPGTYRTDLGILDPLQTAIVQRTFTVRNTSRLPVTVSDVRGSCGCETLLLTRQGAQAKSATLPAGGDADIHLSIRLNPYGSGPVRKYVYIYGTVGQEMPLVTIALDMRLQTSIAFDPPSIDFGTVTAGQSVSRPLTLTVLQSLVAGPDLPTPTSVNPDVTVRAAGTTQQTTVNGQQALRRLFLLTLSAQTPAGSVLGDIRFGSSAPPTGTGPLIQTAALLGTVSGALAAAPSTAFFGSLPWGTAPARAVVITLPPGDTLPLTATTDRSWVTATLSPAPPTALRRLLTIALRKDAPPGDIQADVTVTAGKNTLEIPVVAELTK